MSLTQDREILGGHARAARAFLKDATRHLEALRKAGYDVEVHSKGGKRGTPTGITCNIHRMVEDRL